MNTYRRNIDGSTVNETSLRREARKANISLPLVISDDEFVLLKIDPILRTPKPDATNVFKMVRMLADAVADTDGNWVQGYEEVDKFTEYVDDAGDTITVAMQKTALVESISVTTLSAMSFNAEMDLKDASEGAMQHQREAGIMMQEQARQFKLDNTAPVRALRKRATKLGVTVEKLSNRIIRRADKYEDKSGDIMGKLDAMEDAVKDILDSAGSNQGKITALKALDWDA